MQAVELHVVPERAERLEAALWALGAQAVTLLDAGDHPVHEPEPGETPLWPESVVQALFAEDADRQLILLGLIGGGHVESAAQVRFDELADRDWERVWMIRFRPMRFGRNLWICPSHVEPDAGWPVVVRLDPGLAFGTGTHPTTALCLEWIDRCELKGQSVIDYGTGSGVLAIACALKGAGRVIAVDHDPQALTATTGNARNNGVADRIETYLPSRAPVSSADLVLANILSNPLIDLAPRLAASVAAGGTLVLSGILAEQADRVARAYRDLLLEIERSERDGWVRLVYKRVKPGKGNGSVV